MFSEDQIRRLLDLGNATCQTGMIQEARAIFDGVLAAKPGFIPALVGDAFSHVVVDDFEGAQTILREKVLNEHPDDPDALAMSGLASMLAGMLDEARVTLDRIPVGSPAAAMARTLMEEMS